MSQPSSPAPRIVLTVAVAARQAEPEIAERKNRLYADGVRRHGGVPVVLDATATSEQRAAAFETMDGLVISGGADVDPARYGQPNRGSEGTEGDRDDLEADAWAAAQAKIVPIFGICRGLQAVNVFAGGTLLQHVDGHAGPSWGHGPEKTHPIRLVPGSRLARILSPTNVRGGVLQVNTYHHQGVRAADLAPGLVANAWATSPAGDLVEGFEALDGRFLIAVQCHPERTESTPPAFERLWSVFVDACRGPATRR
jgi:putative glutamine amidotransferase